MFILIGRTSKVVGKLEFWITLKKISSLMYKDALHHSYHDLFLLFGSQELRTGHLGNSLKRNIVSLINSQTDSNLFQIEFIFRCTRNMFLVFFCFHVSQVFFFKGICTRIVFPIHCWDSELPNLFS